MKNKLIIEDQVLKFIQRQPPETRQRIRQVLHDVESGKTFPEPLEEELDGFYKLKVERIRIILQMDQSSGGPVFKAVFGQRRAVVYEELRLLLGLQ